MDEDEEVLRRLGGVDEPFDKLLDCKSFWRMLLLDGISLLLLMFEGVMVLNGHLKVLSLSSSMDFTGFFSSVALRLFPRLAWTLTRGRLIVDILQRNCVKI